MLVLFPQFHISGQWTGVLAPLTVGGSAVLLERFTASGFCAQVTRYGITQTTLLSAMVPFLIAAPERPDDADTTLRKVVMAPVIAEAARNLWLHTGDMHRQDESGHPAALHAELRERLPYFMVPRYLEFYGDLPRTPTQRIQKSELRSAGLTAATWDAQAHGVEARHTDR